MRRSIIILLTALAAACGTQPASNEHAGHNMNAPGGHNAMTNSNTAHSNTAASHAIESSPGAASAPYDLQFIDSMIAHHQGAIQMAELAETRAQHTEIKELAANIINEQERENARMSEWRDSWFDGKGKAINADFPGMHQGMAGMDIGKLERLRGNDFDLEFLRQMIAHHEGAIVMSKDAQAKAEHAEIKELAADIIAAQTEEINEMRKWLTEWSKG